MILIHWYWLYVFISYGVAVGYIGNRLLTYIEDTTAFTLRRAFVLFICGGYLVPVALFLWMLVTLIVQICYLGRFVYRAIVKAW